MKLRPYPEYKDSGVPWLGEIPRHWEIISARQIGHLFKGSGGNKNDEVEKGVPCVRYGDLYTTHEFFILNTRACISPDNLKSYTRIRFGDVLFAASGETIEDIGRSAVNLIRGEACCGGDIIILRPTVEIDPRFLGYALESPAARYQKSSMGRGFTVVHIYGSALKSLVTTFPPLEEQTQIARFLDWKTAQIDRFIRNKRRLIELLKEQKQTLINQAVTGAIDVRTGKPYPEYKDSDVPWLGKVPAHWEIRKFKYLTRFTSGGTPSKSVDSYWHGTLPWVSPKDMKSKEICDAEDHISERAVQDSATGIAKPDDLLIVVRSGILRRTIPVGIVKREVAFNQDIKAIAPKQATISSDYLLFLINGCDHLLRDEWVKVGATVESIEHELMANTYLPVPTLEEQGSITDFCRRIEDSVCKTITRTQREIELMQEYRTRLIADVVTGKLDVRGVVVPDFEKQVEGVTAPNEPEIPACDHEAMA